MGNIICGMFLSSPVGLIVLGVIALIVLIGVFILGVYTMYKEPKFSFIFTGKIEDPEMDKRKLQTTCKTEDFEMDKRKLQTTGKKGLEMDRRKLRTVERFTEKPCAAATKKEPLYRLDPYTLSPLVYANTPNTVNLSENSSQIITDASVNRTNIQFTGNRFF